MATTVRIKDFDKIELDKLQATILLKSGKKLTYDQILHYLLRHAKSKVLEAIIDDVSDQEIKWDNLLSNVDDYGETDSSKADEIIYGDH
ncbi:MAG: hypothetical protein ACW99A_16125 [Candidatus Kariarchaeaceae archaeon]|jgi:hypothetical protein